jgi:hypothetical protein
MTKNQQQIIDALTMEFERINKSITGKGFNLIDTSALQEKTRIEREWKQLVDEDNATWEKAANAEIDRIVELLLQDLPDWVEVERYSPEIGKYYMPKLQIRHERQHHNSHPSEVVTIEVIARKECREDGNGNSGYFGYELAYEPSPMYKSASAITYKPYYKTIEEAVNDPHFKEALRTRVISRIVR